MRYRRNADVDLRELERRAAAGDPEAERALGRYMARTGKLDTAVGIVLRHLRELAPSTVRQIIQTLLYHRDLPRDEQVTVWVVSHGYYDDEWQVHFQGVYGSEQRAWEGMADLALEQVEGHYENDEDLVDIRQAHAARDWERVVTIFRTTPMLGDDLYLEETHLQ
jgi:hypothetical protein